MTVVIEVRKLLHNKRRVSRSVVMMQGPGVVAPLVWTLAPDVFPQSPQNVAIEFSIHRPSWWNKSLPLRRPLFRLRVVPKHLHSSPVMMVEIKLASFLPCSSSSLQTGMQWVSVPFDHCSAALAQILLQCAACW